LLAVETVVGCAVAVDPLHPVEGDGVEVVGRGLTQQPLVLACSVEHLSHYVRQHRQHLDRLPVRLAPLVHAEQCPSTHQRPSGHA
jgi:hypothetical protein